MCQNIDFKTMFCAVKLIHPIWLLKRIMKQIQRGIKKIAGGNSTVDNEKNSRKHGSGVNI